MTIAVTGATGQLGRLVIEALAAKGTSDVVALVRSPDKAADLAVPARAADYAQPETLGPALEGVDTLLLISSSEIGQRAAQHRNVVEAAKAAGVKRIVYTSLLHADVSTIDLAAEHRESEALLAASGIAHTVLRNGWYTENYAGSIHGALAAGAIVGAAGNGQISAAARADFAEAAAVVLTTSGHDGKIYELAGDVPMTLADLAAEVSRRTGREIPYNDMPEAEYAAVLTTFGLPEGFAKMVAGWDTAILNGDLLDESRTLSGLIGRPTTPLADVVAAILS